MQGQRPARNLSNQVRSGGLRSRLAQALTGIARAVQPRLDGGYGDGGGGDGEFGSGIGRGVHSYEGASMARRLSPWRPNRSHINTALAGEGPLLRARTRALVANAPLAASLSETFVSYATGPGIKPSSLMENANQKKAVQQAWRDWTDEADADGLTDFYGLQSLAARALYDAGEVFIRLRYRFASDGLSVPLQLQLIESEQLDSAYTLGPLPNGNIIRSGIEFDPIGRRAAYHFWKVNPGDSTIWIGQGVRTRVPAESVLHIYKPLRPGQIRGRPWLTSVMVKLYDLDQYDDAELSRKKGAAMFMAFLTKNLAADGSSLVDGAATPDENGTADLMMEPSVMNVLPDGMDVKFSQPADVGPNYAAFQDRNLYTAVSAAGGLPYHAVTGDVSKANYSSLRASLVEIKRRIEQFQHETLVFQMCRPVWCAWLPQAVLAGAVSLPGFANPKLRSSYLRVKWIPPKWDWVDPLKDVHAEKVAVDAGFQSRSDVIESRGEDPEETDARIAADHAREEKLGLSFPVGFSKSPDTPAGSDLAPTGGDQSTTEGDTAGDPGRPAPPSGSETEAA